MNTVNCALLIRKDQQATNGIVHIIDTVLDPSKSLADNAADMVLKVSNILLDSSKNFVDMVLKMRYLVLDFF